MKKFSKSAKAAKPAKSKKGAKQTAGKADPKPGQALGKMARKAGEVLKHAEEAVVETVKGKYGRAVPQEAAPVKEAEGIGPRKKYIKSRHAVKVTFRLPREAAPGAGHVSLVGDFNAWDADATPMKRLRDGSFTTVVELEQGREYRFRYLIEGQRWENDWHADRYVPNVFGEEDSVVAL